MHVPRTCHAYLHACAHMHARMQVGEYDFYGESDAWTWMYNHMHARMQVGEYDFYGESDAWTWMYNRRTSMVVHPEEGSYDMFF